MPRYNPAVIEPKWQKYWLENRTFACPRLPEGRKLYVLDMFPYPSGDGLHVGHPEGYTATDIVCRYNRMKGVSVMHPMGWDAFGLPAEQHAKKTGTPPRETTEKNIGTFRRQLRMLGFSYDWDREVATTDVEYFRWTQWIFLVLYDTWFDHDAQKGRPIAELPIPPDVEAEGEAAIERYRDEHRLAYQIEAPVNWCPALGTVLANEEVIGGVSERGGHPVVRAKLRQWMLRITAYADRLEKDLDRLDWSEGIKHLQRNWIGRSTGAEVDFYIGDSGIRGRGAGDGASQSRDRRSRPALPQDDYNAWKKQRAETGFPRKPGDDVLRIYTTRPDTLFGATYMVLAPEHPFVERLTTPEQSEAVAAYCEQAARKSDLDRTDLAKDKSGVWTGSYAVNPVNGESIPIWVADYVLISYGTGAIMAVPAHDTRDKEFAQHYEIPIIRVVDPPPHSIYPEHFLKFCDPFYFKPSFSTAVYIPPCDPPLPFSKRFDYAPKEIHDFESLFQFQDVDNGQGGSYLLCKEKHSTSWMPAEDEPREIQLNEAYVDDGVAINSGSYNGMATSDFKKIISEDMSSQGLGRAAVNYKLRDWLFSRQHFWGEPFPLLHELGDDGEPTGRIRALTPSDLPVDLPTAMEFDAAHDRPEPPLDKAPEDWLYVTIDGVRYKRETNTMPQWAGSCWYYLRFLDPKNDQALVDPQVEKEWMPVDLYVGGAEHAVLHLLYARFWHKVLHDRGHVSSDEPFQKLVNQGMILGENGEKMSKSRGNVVNPDEVVREYGADSLRLYEMFMGPLEAVKPWCMDGVSGVRGFLDRVWRMIVDERDETVKINSAVQDVKPTAEQNRMLHKTIKAVTFDLDHLSFNTAISRMMEFTNYFLKEDVRPLDAMEDLVLLLSPLAPHLAEELWTLLDHDESLAFVPWPKFDEEAIKEDTIEIPVQICGKLRGRIMVPADADRETMETAARAEPKVAEMLEGKTVAKVIVVPGRMVNFVAK